MHRAGFRHLMLARLGAIMKSARLARNIVIIRISEPNMENKSSFSLKCLSRKPGLNGIVGEIDCFFSGHLDSKRGMYVYEVCDFKGDDYRSCPRYRVYIEGAKK